MVEISTVLDGLVAVGTLGLAAAAFWGIRQNGKQVRALTRQTLILRAQNAPIPVVSEFQFIGDGLKLTIQNTGKSPISALVLSSQFMPTKREIYDEKRDGRQLGPDEVEMEMQQKKQLYQRFSMLVPPEFVVDGKKINPVDTSKFLLHPVRKDNTLMPGETVTYEVEPVFGLNYKNPPPYFSTEIFAGLKEKLEANEISAVAVRFGILAKDWSEELLQPHDMANFIVDFAVEKTLEEGFKSKRRPYFEPLSRQEFMSTFGSIETDTWRTSRSPQYSPYNFEEEL
jgi:hypothetical protein